MPLGFCLATQLFKRVREIVVGIGICGVEVESLPQGRYAVVGFAQFGQHDSQVVPRGGERPIDLHRLAEPLHRLLTAVLSVQDVAQIEACRRIRAAQRQGLSVGVRRLGELTGFFLLTPHRPPLLGGLRAGIKRHR